MNAKPPEHGEQSQPLPWQLVQKKNFLNCQGSRKILRIVHRMQHKLLPHPFSAAWPWLPPICCHVLPDQSANATRILDRLQWLNLTHNFAISYPSQGQAKKLGSTANILRWGIEMRRYSTKLPGCTAVQKPATGKLASFLLHPAPRLLSSRSRHPGL